MAKWTIEKVREEQLGRAANFSWYETYSNVLEAIPNKTARALLALAIIEYGAYGREPQFTDVPLKDGVFPGVALQAIFEANRVNIDNSVVSHYVSHLGGRKSKAERAEENKNKQNEEALKKELNGIPDPARGELVFEEIPASVYEEMIM